MKVKMKKIEIKFLLISLILVQNSSCMHRINRLLNHIQPHTAQSVIPSTIWQYRSLDQKLTKDEMLNCFIEDCQKCSKENAVIPDHQKNERTVRIATYNVHFWADPFKKLNFDNIINVISKVNADIFVLQEVTGNPDQLKKLFAKIGYNNFVFMGTTNLNNFGNLIISKYPFVGKPITKIFRVDKNRNYKRGFINVKIKISNDKIISVYGTHLDVYDNSEKRRFEEIKELIEVSQKDNNENIMILGDFNSVRMKDYQYEINKNLVWDMLNKSNEQRNGFQTPTITLETLEKEGYKTSFEFANKPSPKFTVWSGTVIDFIYLHRNWNLPTLGSYIWYNSCSDHLSVMIDISKEC